MAETALVWLRNDLRVADNPALQAALLRGGPVIAVHVEETDARLRPRGAASRWWLNRSLQTLAEDLAELGVALETIRGSIMDTVKAHGPTAVHWNRRYGPAERAVDTELKGELRRMGVAAESFEGDTLIEPFDIATKTGAPYSVFTPFWSALRERDIATPLPAPGARRRIKAKEVDTAYQPEPWTKKLEQCWQIGERAAAKALGAFLDRIEDYPEGRDYPARDATSRLSPHLAFGEISPRQVWHAGMALAAREPARAGAVDAFLRELAWRDFNIHQLYHRPDIANHPMQEKFAAIRWRDSKKDLTAWQKGETGFAIVDAGMKELWETGYMHNRVRMLTASLFTKNLLLDWRQGEAWFWDCLVDADAANNAGNWQWVAGCGTDAAPYFRIFNPETQAGRFDPEGDYVKRWSPQAAQPIVDLKSSRERALAAYKAL